jgi:hypothetical protein
VVSELGKAALDKEAKDESEYAAEKAAITGTWSALLNIADDKCNRLLKFGDDRTAKQGQRDAAYAVLAAALAAKRDAGIRGGDGGVIRLDEDAQEHGAAREGTRRRA